MSSYDMFADVGKRLLTSLFMMELKRRRNLMDVFAGKKTKASGDKLSGQVWV